jgi:3-oxoadipate CoA-transferase alpha subunit
VVLIAGYAGTGWPESLIRALADLGSKNLTVICQGEWGEHNGGSGIRPLLSNGQLRKLISPMPFYPLGSAEGPMGEVESQWKSGELELEVVPQGILAERLRSGGAGLGGIFLPTGAGSCIATNSSAKGRFGKEIEVRNIGGRDHRFESGLKADFALLRARYSDALGNLIYRGTQRNWNPVMAMAARVSIAEVDEIHEAGGLDGELVVTPGIFVKRIVKTV